MNVLPRYEDAVIPVNKFTKYALDPDKQKDKAEAFRIALGYDSSNFEHLIQNIMSNLPRFECISKGDLGHGMRYEVIMSLMGPNGKTAKVLTAWIDDKENGEMRLTTVHVDK